MKKRWNSRIAVAVAISLSWTGLAACGFGKDVETKTDDVSPTEHREAARDTEETGQTEAPVYQNNLPENWREEHTRVRGIYVTGPMAGNAAMEDLITLVDETELNAMVIDVKNDDGNITFKMQLPAVEEMEAGVRYIADIDALMQTLNEHEIYTIARIVCFKDPCLATHRPELALKKPDGTPVTDANGNAFVNPYCEEAWEYIVDVAEEAADLGFDEIQFDYVRFPIGEDADAADYGVDMTVYTKEQAITNFLTYASARLHEKGIVLGADVFGTIIGSDTDIECVGQNYQALGEEIDVLSPMVYPSHYDNGVFGLDVPDAHPYEAVLRALEGSVRELDVVPDDTRAVVRPWLQAFTASWVDGYITYDGQAIRDQIQAVYDAGYEEWILWNATNRYSADGLLPAGQEAAAASEDAVNGSEGAVSGGAGVSEGEGPASEDADGSESRDAASEDAEISEGEGAVSGETDIGEGRDEGDAAF